jgi:hypothetical protein
VGAPQPAIGFDPDHHVVWLCDVIGDQLVKHPDADQPFGQPTRRQPRPVSIHYVNIVVILGPIVSDEDHPFAS